MTDFPSLRARLGLSTGALARLCGVERRTAERWVSGSIPCPAPALRLLWLCAEVPGALDALLEHTPCGRQEAR